jgi:hypothetical protein
MGGHKGGPYIFYNIPLSNLLYSIVFQYFAPYKNNFKLFLKIFSKTIAFCFSILYICRVIHQTVEV